MKPSPSVRLLRSPICRLLVPVALGVAVTGLAAAAPAADEGAGWRRVDVATGRVTYEARRASSMVQESRPGAGALATTASAPPPAKSFAEPTPVEDPAAPPWSAVVLIEASGNERCTGTLVDPLHVLTAAHCLYDDGEWRTSITVTPAYQDGTAPFGTARGVDVFTLWDFPGNYWCDAEIY